MYLSVIFVQQYSTFLQIKDNICAQSSVSVLSLLPSGEVQLLLACASTGGSIGAWASLGIKGHVLSPSYATSIANYLVWLPKRQRMSCESISAQMVQLVSVSPEVIYREKDIRIGLPSGSSSGCLLGAYRLMGKCR